MEKRAHIFFPASFVQIGHENTKKNHLLVFFPTKLNCILIDINCKEKRGFKGPLLALYDLIRRSICSWVLSAFLRCFK